jgi:hypothetical protein
MLVTSMPPEALRWIRILPWLLATLGRLGCVVAQEPELDLAARVAPVWQTSPSAQGDMHRSGPETLPALTAPAGSALANLQLTAWALPWNLTAIGHATPSPHASSKPIQTRNDLSLRLAGSLGGDMGVEVVLRTSRMRTDDGVSPAGWQRTLGDVESVLVVGVSADPRCALAVVVGTLTPLAGAPSLDWLQGHGRLADGGCSGIGELRLATSVGGAWLTLRSRLTATPHGENRLQDAATTGVVHDRYQGWEQVLGMGWRLSPGCACALEGAWQRRTWSGSDPWGSSFFLESITAPVVVSISTSLAGMPDEQLQLFAGEDCAHHQRSRSRERLRSGILLSGWW